MRHDLHARALSALLEEGAPPAEAAPHALASEVKGDPRTVAVLVAAGRQALAAGASATAVEHLGAALRAAGGNAPPSLRLQLAEAHLLTGRVSAAEDVVGPARPRGPQSRRRGGSEQASGPATHGVGTLPGSAASKRRVISPQPQILAWQQRPF
ncbi:MAG: tetratricopeptide repeat protein [Actinomycetota bacterium]|nr:tetratricopeptide repeat protein [Actinomycetota bacterium]